MNNSSMDNRLKIFLKDPELRNKYNIAENTINSMTMTINKEDDIMIILIKELILKQSEESTERIAATRLNQMLDNRLSKMYKRGES